MKRNLKSARIVLRNREVGETPTQLDPLTLSHLLRPLSRLPILLPPSSPILPTAQATRVRIQQSSTVQTYFPLGLQFRTPLTNGEEMAHSENIKLPPIFIKDVRDFSSLVTTLSALLR